MTKPVSFRPEKQDARQYLYRAAAAHVRAFRLQQTPQRSAKDLFGDDEPTGLILRSAQTQATIASPTWAGALAQQAIEDAVMAIASVSAAAALIQRGMKIDFSGRASIRIPGRILDATDAG